MPTVRVSAATVPKVCNRGVTYGARELLVGFGSFVFALSVMGGAAEDSGEGAQPAVENQRPPAVEDFANAP
jgi:hypothetical protein